MDLNCVVAGQPQATITWYKRGGSLPTRHQVQSAAQQWGWDLCLRGWADQGQPHGQRTRSISRQPQGCPPSHLAWVDSGQPQRVLRERLGKRPDQASNSLAPRLPLPLLPHPGPQAHGSHLRLYQMSVADSGEYVCRANNNIDAREASIMVSVSPNAGSPSGESDEGPGRGTRSVQSQGH